MLESLLGTRSTSHRSQETLLPTLVVDNDVSALSAANVELLRLITPAQSECYYRVMISISLALDSSGLCAVTESRSVGRTQNAPQLRELLIVPA